MRRVLFVVAALGLIAGMPPAMAQDPVKVDAKHYKVELENDQVRVLRISYGPHEKSVMHEHPASVAVFLTDGHARFTLADGKTQDAPFKAGSVQWDGGGKHLPENVGDKPFDLVLVELKAKPGTAVPAMAQDSVKVDPKHYKVELENEQARVLRITYGPHEKSVMHEHPASVAIFLTDGKVKFTLPDGKTQDVPVKASSVQWDGGGKHLPENVGDKPFELVLVELKTKPVPAK